MKRTQLALVIVAAALSQGCISETTLGRLHSTVRPEAVLTRPEITGLIARGSAVGGILLGAMTVILAFVCWYRATQGSPFVGLAKEWIVGVGVALWILTTVQSTGLGPVRWIYEAGSYLGDLFKPQGGYFAANHDLAVARLAQFIQRMQTVTPAPSGMEQSALEWIEAVSHFVLNPIASLGIVLNGIAIHLFKLVLQVSYTFLLVFYWTMTPIVAPMLVLPQTRHVFVGWAKAYLSVALWPFFFAIVEQISIAIPWSTWLSSDDVTVTSNWALALSGWVQGQVMLVVLNIAFLGVYASIPIVSSRIVNGASQPFRAGLL